ncbi:MAG: cytochrome c [Desulfobacterales bacterium]|jgi:cytochrome c556
MVALCIATGALAQFSKPEDAIRYRKSVMVLIGQHFKALGAVVKGKVAYDPQAFAADAELVQTLATLPWEAALVPGTDKGDTTMNSEVLAEKDDFMENARAFEAATTKLAESARTGTVDAAKGPFNEVAQNCKACHKRFRK